MLETWEGLGQAGQWGTFHPGSCYGESPTYHAVLVLLGGVVHGCVPRIGPASVHLSRVQLPVPGRREGGLSTGSPLLPSLSLSNVPDACSVQGPEKGRRLQG